MRVQKIGPEHARALGRLEAEIYPTGFCLGWQDFREDLEKAEADGGNFSFGLFEGEDHMVGYLIAYLDEEMIYVSDFAILPDYRAKETVTALLAEFLRAASEAGLQFYAECRESTRDVCTKHPRFFRRFGYELVESRVLPSYNNGEDHWRARFEYKAAQEVLI
jgi:N-acetylglutamate synthase-like GNAT family acetyltransferase